MVDGIEFVRVFLLCATCVPDMLSGGKCRAVVTRPSRKSNRVKKNCTLTFVHISAMIGAGSLAFRIQIPRLQAQLRIAKAALAVCALVVYSSALPGRSYESKLSELCAPIVPGRAGGL